MKPWQVRLEKLLSDADAPPALTRDLLDRFARSARNGRTVPKSTLSWWIRQAVTAGKLVLVQRGLYLNQFRGIPGLLADTVPLLHKDAVVSLNTVLGDAGVLNNPSTTVTAVVPLDSESTLPHLGRCSTKAGTLHFYGMPRRILEAGKPRDRLEPEDRYEHARATPEKALMDWLYLAQSPRSNRTPPPRNDIDISLLTIRRLRRLADAVGLAEELKRCIENSTA
jgi:hypothetical protein